MVEDQHRGNKVCPLEGWLVWCLPLGSVVPGPWGGEIYCLATELHSWKDLETKWWMLESVRNLPSSLGAPAFILPTHGHQRALAPLSSAVGLLRHSPPEPQWVAGETALFPRISQGARPSPRGVCSHWCYRRGSRQTTLRWAKLALEHMICFP